MPDANVFVTASQQATYRTVGWTGMNYDYRGLSTARSKRPGGSCDGRCSRMNEKQFKIIGFLHRDYEENALVYNKISLLCSFAGA